MKYDYDLRWARTAALGFVALDLVTAGWNAYAGNWATVAACVVWAGNCFAWLSLIRGQQRTRDQGRILESAVNGILAGKVNFDDR